MSSLQVDIPDWQVPKRVKAFTTTVYSGVSDGVFSSLNLGDHVGDDPNLVLQNRALVKTDQSLPSEPVWLKQVHSTDIVELGKEALVLADGSLVSADGSSITADGSYTRKLGAVCAIMTADCMPLFLSTCSGDCVALLHAGWRGLADGIVESGVEALGCPVDEIVAWAGPCIGPEAFEIGDEVRQQLGGSHKCYKLSPNSMQSEVKWLANLYQLTAERLANIGVRHYSHSNECTYSNERYFSYRRTGQCGRMASFIWIDE